MDSPNKIDMHPAMLPPGWTGRQPELLETGDLQVGYYLAGMTLAGIVFKQKYNLLAPAEVEQCGKFDLPRTLSDWGVRNYLGGRFGLIVEGAFRPGAFKAEGVIYQYGGERDVPDWIHGVGCRLDWRQLVKTRTRMRAEPIPHLKTSAGCIPLSYKSGELIAVEGNTLMLQHETTNLTNMAYPFCDGRHTLVSREIEGSDAEIRLTYHGGKSWVHLPDKNLFVMDPPEDRPDLTDGLAADFVPYHEVGPDEFVISNVTKVELRYPKPGILVTMERVGRPARLVFFRQRSGRFAERKALGLELWTSAPNSQHVVLEHEIDPALVGYDLLQAGEARTEQFKYTFSQF